MKRLITIILMLIQFVPILLLAQNMTPTKVFSEDETIKHYWYYRERLKYFVHPGPNIGEGQIGGIRNSLYGNCDQYGCGGVKNISWGQHNIYFGYYIGVLATEYYLLGEAQNSTQQQATLDEINSALNQWTSNLDNCEMKHYSKPNNSTDGFFIRTDVDPDNFFKKTTPIGIGDYHLSVFNEGLDENSDVYDPTTHKFGSLPAGHPGYAIYIDGWDVPSWAHKDEYFEAMSNDEAIGLLLGLSLVYRYTEGNTHVDAKNIALRVVDYIANHHGFDCWWIFDPTPEAVSDQDGGNALLLSGGYALYMQNFFYKELTDYITPGRIFYAIQQWNVYQLETYTSNSDSKNAAMFATLAAMGNSWSVPRPFPLPPINTNCEGIETTTSGYFWQPFYELLYRCLYSDGQGCEMPSINLERYRAQAKLILSDVPDEGPYFYNDHTHAGGGWACSYRWHRWGDTQNNGDDESAGNYNALDLMLLINLQLITERNYGDGVNLNNYHPFDEGHLSEIYPIKINDNTIIGTNALPAKAIYFKTITSGSKIQANTNYYLSNGQPVPLNPPIIGVSGNVSYLAGEKITLEPGKVGAGFTVERGAKFTAAIKKPLIFYFNEFSENSGSYLRDFLMMNNLEKLTSSDLENTKGTLVVDSISELISNENIKIYPNPTKGIFCIAVNSQINTNTGIIISDFDGRVIKNISTFDCKINVDISSEKSGIYFIRIISNNNCKILKLIKY